MRPARLERATYSFGGCHSIQLSYGRSFRDYSGASAKHNRSLVLLLLTQSLGRLSSMSRKRQGLSGCNSALAAD